MGTVADHGLTKVKPGGLPISRLSLFYGAALAVLSTALPAVAQVSGQPGTGGATVPADVSAVIVAAHRLAEDRADIEPSLGATSYTLDNSAIQSAPGGDNQQLNQVVLQLPGVVQDSFGQFHVRDDHNGVQYRINGVILPEGLSVFGQTLSPRLIDTLSLRTGALPAQYGLSTAGIIDITTKSGLFDNGGQAAFYGGSHSTYDPSLEYGGHVGATNFFISGEYKRTGLGIESPDGSSTPLHDKADEANLFVYADRVLNDENRVSFTGGYANDLFQIPNTPGLQPGNGFSVNGVTTFPSETLNETQRETTGFAAVTWLHDVGKTTIQTSLFGRYSTLRYNPDPLGDLLYNGIVQNAYKQDSAFGVQSEAVDRLSDAHTLRAGLIIQGDRGTSQTSSQVLPVAANGGVGTMPMTIIDNGAKDQFTYSLYAQDEWKLLPSLTLNYGLRGDSVNGYRNNAALSPRVNLVWQPTTDTTLHAGYARYFNPSPFELVGNQTVSKFQNTTAASQTTQDTTPFPERQDYYDLGGQQKLMGGNITFGLDVFYRQSDNLIDEGQFGAPIILTPFNYKKGEIFGQELSLNFANGPLTAYVNFTHERAQGKNIDSSQFSFDPGDLTYIATHYIFLDHDQTYTASAGASYLVKDGPFRGTRLSFDLLYGSGLRRDETLSNGDTIPNGAHVPSYVTINLSVAHHLTLPRLGHVDLRLDVTNVGDKIYEIRDGTGVGVGAPQFGARRGFFGGISKTF